MPDEITDAVRGIVAEELGFTTSEVWPDTQLHKELNMDSLDRMNLSLAIEEQFHLDDPISEADAEQFQTVGDLVRYVREHTVTEHL